MGFGEPLESGLRREFREETGLEINIQYWVQPMDRLIRDADKNLQEHILYLDVVAEVKEGRFNPASDVGEGAWFSKEELGTILNEMHEDTQKLLREAKLLD